MVATVITETQWHGNPRGPADYAIGAYVESVPSPYYNDGRDVPVYLNFVTEVPADSLTPVSSIDIAGPGTNVAFSVGGVFQVTQGVSVAITRTTGVNGDYSESIINNTTAMTGVEFAAYVASVIDAEDDMTAITDGANQVLISAVAPVTALTITAVTVV